MKEVYVIRKISDGFYFEEFISERSASWGTANFATEFTNRNKAYRTYRKINEKYGYKVAYLEKITK